MPNGITKETFEQMDINNKLNVLFDHLEDNNKLIQSVSTDRQDDVEVRQKHCKKQWNECDTRFKKIERLHHGIIAVLLLANVLIPTAAMMWS